MTVFDRMPTPGRKFLMAGRGGLNITHSEALDRFLPRYGAGAALVAPALAGFDPDALRRWCAELGEETVVGTQRPRVPASFKASPLLRAWLRRLGAAGVAFRPRHRWTGWDGDGALRFEAPDGERAERFDAAVLAMGGASWPQLGSDGRWTAALEAEGAAVAPLRPSNCGFAVAWSAAFRDRFEGEPLKGVALGFGRHRSRGEAVVTRAGIEGGGIYALSGPLRDAIAAEGSALLRVDLQPDRPRDAVVARLAAARAGKASVSTALRKALHLSPVAVGLLQEAAHAEGRPLGARDDAAWRRSSAPCRCGSTRPCRSRAPSPRRAGSPPPSSTRATCCAAAPAPSRPARCWTGRRRPAATCCRPASPPAPRRGPGRSPGWREAGAAHLSCRNASPSTMAAATATLSERKPGRIGTATRRSAAACTSSGTPADSRPTISTSPGRKAASR